MFESERKVSIICFTAKKLFANLQQSCEPKQSIHGHISSMVMSCENILRAVSSLLMKKLSHSSRDAGEAEKVVVGILSLKILIIIRLRATVVGGSVR